MKTLSLGYSPYGAPPEPARSFPFDQIFDYGINLQYADSLHWVDAVVLWGGEDISPSLYDTERIDHSGPAVPSERDLFEWHILKEAKALGKPIIGVCRGAQMVCAFAGGKLVQDVSGHGNQHLIECYDGKKFSVTSSHHQMLYPYNVPHKLLAWSQTHKSKYYRGMKPEESQKFLDKIVKEPEVVYFPEINAMAIQCHPEWHPKKDDFNDWILNQIIEKQFATSNPGCFAGVKE
jgi:putative glutamine amidotransferase